MKLVVQCSAMNEEKTLPLVLSTIPKKIPGIDSIEIVVVDDGSTDNTVQVAKKLGVKHIVRHNGWQGLAYGFRSAINKSLELGADIIVHTDGDNQYPSKDIPRLIKPILEEKADMVIADRQVKKVKDFSADKKILQRVGTRLLNAAANTQVPDAPSGFRAYSRKAAMRLNTMTDFSYAMETLIQAGNKRFAIATITITPNPKTRKSRLFKSHAQYLSRSGAAILRAFLMYRPYAFFGTLGSVFLVLGLIPFARYLYFVLQNEGGGHLQSLVLGSVLLIAAFIAFTLGVVADLIRINRILLEQNLEHTKHIRFDKR